MPLSPPPQKKRRSRISYPDAQTEINNSKIIAALPTCVLIMDIMDHETLKHASPKKKIAV